jgi:serine/threonine protein kinase/formylglycine-generating enzyme required for sulfatase activity
MKECPACKRCFPDHVNHCPNDGDATTLSIAGEPILDGRYQLEKRLGHGGMGVVFKARHIFLKTAHAIKVILPDLVGNDPMLVTRFRQEALAAAAIRHQNIINVTDFGVARGTMPFLVMEFVQGKSLHDVLAAEGSLPPTRALDLMAAVGAGVAAAHRQNIVHRDLKPLNIMIQDNLPISEAIKVLDFGLAKIKSGELLGSFVQAKTSGLMGSPFYMAPEQWSDEEPDVRADIYSLGVILYQMLGGDVPFKGTGIPSIMKKHLTAAPPTFSSLGINIPPSIEAVVRHALEKEADNRPQTVEAFVSELRDAVAQTSASLNRTSLGQINVQSDTIVSAPAPAAVSMQGKRDTTLRIRTSPPQSRIFIDNMFIGTSDASGQLNITDVKPGSYRVRIVHDNFAEWEQQIECSGGECPIDARLQSLMATSMPQVSHDQMSGTISSNQLYDQQQSAQQPGYSSMVEAQRLRAQAAALEEQVRREDEARRREQERREMEERDRIAREEVAREEEARRLMEEERKRKEAEEKRRAEEEAARLRAEEDARRRAEDEARQKAAEEERRRIAEEARQQAQAEAASKLAEEQARLKAEAEAAAEAARQQAREEATRKLAEEEARLRAETEAARKRAEEEAAARKMLEEETGRLRAEQAESKKRAEEDAKRRAEEERLRAEAEAKRKAEEERRQAEAEVKRRAEEAARRKTEEATRQRAETEAAARKKAEEEAARLRAEHAAAQKRAEEEAQRRAELEARRAEEDRQREERERAAQAERERQSQAERERLERERRELEEQRARLASTVVAPAVNLDATQQQRQGVTTQPVGPDSLPGVQPQPQAQVGWQSQPQFQTSSPGFAAEPKKSSMPMALIAGIVAVVLVVGGGGAWYALSSKSPDPVVQKDNNGGGGGQQQQQGDKVGPTAAVKQEMVQIPGGTFQMGRSDGVLQEGPVHPVTVSPFYIDKTEVTNSEYGQFVQETKRTPPMHFSGDKPAAGQEQLPVTNVSLEDAKAFAEWRSKRDKKTYRLPTEEEWEYAARGEGGSLYPWGNTWSSGRANVGTASLAPVGSHQEDKSSFGVFDLIGNAYEWTSTKASYYPGNATPVKADNKNWMVFRGGAYVTNFSSNPISATYRNWIPPDTKNSGLGFRLVRVD